MADIDPWERNIDWQLLIAFSHSNRAITRLTRAVGLTPGQPKILQYLTTHNGCTQKEICDSWSYSRQTINTALKNLERQGILCLKTAEGNRKNKRIYFSREGKAFADRVVAPFVRAELLSLERLGDREREQLTRLNERRTEYFRQELEEAMAANERNENKAR